MATSFLFFFVLIVLAGTAQSGDEFLALETSNGGSNNGDLLDPPCPKFALFATGPTLDDDLYVTGSCVDATLRTWVYIIFCVVEGLGSIVGCVHFYRLSHMAKAKRNHLLASGALTGARFSNVFLYFACMYRWGDPARHIFYAFASSLCVLSLVTVLIIWNTAQLSADLSQTAVYRTIEVRRRQAWIGFIATMGCYLFGLPAAGVVQRWYPVIGNTIISACQIVSGVGVAIFGAIILWCQRQLSLRIETMMSTDTPRIRKLKKRLPVYSRVVAGQLLSLGALSVVVSVIAFAGPSYIEGFFYLLHFVYLPAGIVINAVHLFTSWWTPSGQVSSESSNSGNARDTPGTPSTGNSKNAGHRTPRDLSDSEAPSPLVVALKELGTDSTRFPSTAYAV